MDHIYFVAAFWFLTAVLSTIIANRLKISVALMEIIIGAAIGFAAKIIFKILGLYPVIHNFRDDAKEKWYYTLLMSTGLTFGTISALYGLTHNIITQEQYSYIVGVVIASAVVPTLIASKFFLPKHLLAEPVLDDQIPDTDMK